MKNNTRNVILNKVYDQNENVVHVNGTKKCLFLKQNCEEALEGSKSLE